MMVIYRRIKRHDKMLIDNEVDKGLTPEAVMFFFAAGLIKQH